jgi:glucuronoarabinoxylan endo-1,4-beta-xylanase
MTRFTRSIRGGRVALALALALGACSPSPSPEVGGQSNWLRACASSDECSGLECVCGACTAPCASEQACAELPFAACVAASDDGAIALCSGQEAPSAVCLPRCEPSCASGTSCVAGVCVPAAGAAVRVTIDPGERQQTLAGFGASLAYAEDVIVARPDKAALYDLAFADSGLDVLRMRNRHEAASDTELDPQREIVAAASERLGRAPLVFMTSGTPPAALKANGSRGCAGDPQTCTLVSLPGGGFDYAGFAAHWRASLDAYASAGISPDYVSIQNNPNWVPAADNPNDACRFLPEEGTTAVTIAGAPVEVAYPGYREALAAVRVAVADLPLMPRFAAPEANELGVAEEYVQALDASAFDALAIHLYYLDVDAIDDAAFSSIRAVAERLARPVFQTEMQADGLATAILIHHALTAAGASAYLQNDLVSWTPELASIALVLMTPGGFEAQGPYYALSHYAKHTDPGWVRVGAASASTDLLGSAWFAPDESALTIVLVNPGAEQLDAELVFTDAPRSRFGRGQVTRTVFAGTERSAALGELPADGVVRIPGGSIVTVALAAD